MPYYRYTPIWKKSTRKAIRSLDKKIKKIRNDEEIKWQDQHTHYGLFNNPTTGWDAAMLTDIAQGDSSIERIGDKVRCTSLKFNGYFQPTNAFLAPVSVRFMIIRDLLPNYDNVNNYNVSPIFFSPDHDGVLDTSAETNVILAPYNRATQPRFKIYYDRVITLNPTAVALTGTVGGITTTDSFAPVRKFIKGKIKFNFESSFATEDSNSTIVNALWLFAYSDMSSSDGTLDMFMFTRLNYKDE